MCDEYNRTLIQRTLEIYERKKSILRPYYLEYLDSLPVSKETWWYHLRTGQRLAADFLRRRAYPYGVILLWSLRLLGLAVLAALVVILVPIVAFFLVLALLGAMLYWTLEEWCKRLFPVRSRRSVIDPVICSPKPVATNLTAAHIATLRQLDTELCALFVEITSTEITACPEGWRDVLPMLECQLVRSLALYAYTDGRLMRLRREVREYGLLLRRFPGGL